MGMIVEFPADAALRRRGLMPAMPALADMGTVLILPVIRIERHGDDAGDGPSREGGAAPPGRPRRRGRS
mgnify:CR=1 FL=1